MNAEKKTILDLLKLRLGIKSTSRDYALMANIEGILSEFTDIHGYEVDLTKPHVQMFIVDYADWRYSNRGELGAMPRHLQFRLHNLEISQRGESLWQKEDIEKER